MLHRIALVVGLSLCAAACSGDEPLGPTGSTTVPDAGPAAAGSSTTSADAAPPPSGVQPCADVVDVGVTGDGDGFRFDVTVRSGDTGWDKYADAWVVRDPAGVVLAERELLHPHENEQPFTRSLSGVTIPEGVTQVVIAARDSVNGFCGETVTVVVPR